MPYFNLSSPPPRLNQIFSSLRIFFNSDPPTPHHQPTGSQNFLHFFLMFISGFLQLSQTILDKYGISQGISGYLGLSQAISGYYGLSWAILGYIELFLALSGHKQLFQLSLAISGCFWQLLANSGCIWLFITGYLC